MSRFSFGRACVLSFMMTLAAGLPTLRPSLTQARPVSLMTMTEISSGQQGQYMVKATINNHMVSVLVDTGASTVALSQRDADQVGLQPRTLNYNVPVATANGGTKAARVKLTRVDVEGVRVDDVDALVLPEGALSNSLLGMSFLSRLAGFKFENGKMTLRN